ncbi:hypothetical protein M438DRAFT_358846 [Aureobasidium pullulans EXF-150]|uniref:Uncharacterized protein n=1 Tax=Aureobasidium pullulans EXF-150 TaxID=1043002 RepID=A0A074Y0F9_AURPU|nr:uncharacterized protein M438DRAFT_358846 [Aureobasidium pullulans EXF-150]KEQ80396.1 hypothetical protein M438DRAFT_358846 [Aureobasidium pullulans EXF-150]
MVVGEIGISDLFFNPTISVTNPWCVLPLRSASFFCSSALCLPKISRSGAESMTRNREASARIGDLFVFFTLNRYYTSDHILTGLKERFVRATGSEWDQDWLAIYPPTQPRQNNDIDCGMYVLVNALHIMVGHQAPSACCVSIWRAMFSMLLHRTSELPVEHFSNLPEILRILGISTPVPVAEP